MEKDNKTFLELLKEIKKFNKIDLIAQAFQVKYAKETAGEDDDQRKKDANKTNELLEDILTSLDNTKEEEKSQSITGATSPNILNTPEEILAHESKKQTVIFNDLFEISEKSLNELKKISLAITGDKTPASLFSKRSAAGAGGAGGAGSGGTGGGSFLGSLLGGAAGGGAVAAGAKAAGVGKAASAAGTGGLFGGIKGAMAAGGGAALSTVGLIAAPFAANAIAKTFGVGGEASYIDPFKGIDNKQAEENFKKMSFVDKAFTTLAAGIEDVGSFIAPNIANEARADRIKKQTKYLALTEGERELKEKDPKTFVKYEEFTKVRTKEYSYDLAKSQGRQTPNEEDIKAAESRAKAEASQRFSQEIEAAGIKPSKVKPAPVTKKSEVVPPKDVPGSSVKKAVTGAPTSPGSKVQPGDSQQKEFDRRVEEKLSTYDPKMREELRVQRDVKDEVSVEMGGFVPSSKIQKPTSSKEKSNTEPSTTLPGKQDPVSKKVDSANLTKDKQKAQTKAKEQYQAAKKQEQEVEKKIKEFEKTAGPMDLKPRTATEDFFSDGKNVGYTDPKKQKEYEKLKQARAAASESKIKAGADYTAAEGVTKTFAFTGGQAPGESRIDSLRAGMQSDSKKLEALKNRGYTDEDLGRDDSLTKNFIKTSDGAKYPFSALGLYEKVVKQELETPVEGKASKTKDVKGKPAQTAEGETLATSAAPKEKSIGKKIAGFFGFGSKESEGSKPQQESTGSSYGDAVNKRTEELIAKAPANLKDDIGYQRRKRQQAELEVKAGKTLKGKPLAPVEEAPKEKSIGQKIAGFFGFGDKDEKSTMAESAPDTYSEPKTIEQLAMEEANKFGRDKPNVEDKKAASMAFRKQALGGKSEGTLTGVSTIPKDKAKGKEARIQEKLNELPENMRNDPDVQQSIQEEVDMGEGRHLRRNNKGKYKDQPVSELQPKDGGFMKVGLSKNKKSFLGTMFDAVVPKPFQKSHDLENARQQGNISREEYINELGKLKPDQRRYQDTKLLESSKRDSKINSQLPDLPKTEPVRPRRPGGFMSSVEGGFKKASLVPYTSAENAAMREEMTAGKTQATPIVMNNVSNNNTTTYIPIKGEPRPGSRGSALDRYNDRTASYI